MSRLRLFQHRLWVVAVIAGFAGSVWPETPSPLFVRGYSVLPVPQEVELRGGDFPFDSGWRLELRGLSDTDVAVETLRDELSERAGLSLGNDPQHIIRIAVAAGTVEIGAAQDRDKDALREQAYTLSLAPREITISGNTATGAFYGVQTLIQLLRPSGEKYFLPKARIRDWPDLELREIAWDNQNHLDRIETLEQAIRRAAFFKANAFTLKINDHFQFASAPAVVGPSALTPAQFQALTDFALHRHVQLVPYLDWPAHLNFILKHPEYARLREFPDDEFEMCDTNPEAFRLVSNMFGDLLAANGGVKYIHLSTDEAWFIGQANTATCHSVERARELGSPSRLWVESATRMADFLHQRGRVPIIWGENPLEAQDIQRLPAYVVNGEVYGPEFDRNFRQRGIRQMIYTWTQGETSLFPLYFSLAPAEQVNARTDEQPALERMLASIAHGTARRDADLMGVDVFAWGNNGLHPETFWLGYAAGITQAWHPVEDAAEARESFYRLFYGAHASRMDRVYQLLSRQAQFWESSWESVPWGDKPSIGGSFGLRPYAHRFPTLPLPALPELPYLNPRGGARASTDEKRAELTARMLAENDELIGLLNENLPAVQYNRYSLEVFLTIAQICRHNLTLLEALDGLRASVAAGQAAAEKLDAASAVAALDDVVNATLAVRDERNQVLRDATKVWFRGWYPRVGSANGRKYLLTQQPADDAPEAWFFQHGKFTDDPQQLGLRYLLAREFMLPLGEWFGELLRVRNGYAQAHGLAARELQFDWQDTAELHGRPIRGDQ